MTEPSKPTMRAASAGGLLIGTIILCGAVGFGLGSLVGAAVPLLLAGLFVGPIAGVLLVRSRFRDL